MTCVRKAALLVLLLEMRIAAGTLPSCRQVNVPDSLQGEGNVRCDTGHYVCPPSKDNARGELLLYFGGTGGKPTNKNPQKFYTHAQSLGFHVVSICYANARPAIGSVCKDAQNAAQCFVSQRREKLYNAEYGGIPRALKLLKDLSDNRATSGDGWRAFLTSGGQELDYTKIIAGGHSQGAGMAAFVAKRSQVLGVVMLAGVTDVVSDGNAAPWVSAASKTPASAIYGLGNTLGSACSKWSVAWPAMGLSGWFKADGVRSTQTARVPQNSESHMLCSKLQLSGYSGLGDYHNIVLTSEVYKPVWTYMLTRGASARPGGNDYTSSGCSCDGVDPRSAKTSPSAKRPSNGSPATPAPATDKPAESSSSASIDDANSKPSADVSGTIYDSNSEEPEEPRRIGLIIGSCMVAAAVLIFLSVLIYRRKTSKKYWDKMDNKETAVAFEDPFSRGSVVASTNPLGEEDSQGGV